MLSGYWLSDTLSIFSLLVMVMLFVMPFIIREEPKR